MNIAIPKTPAELAYALAGADIALPHRRLEDWRWTDLRQLIDRAYPPVAAAPSARRVRQLAKRSPFGNSARWRLVFFNGRLDREQSIMPETRGIHVADLAVALPEWVELPLTLPGDPILSLNRAFASGGAALRIAAGTILEEPIEVMYVSDAEERTASSRLVVQLEDNSAVSLVETHLSGIGPHVSNSVTTASIGDGARLDRVKLQAEGEQAIHLANFHADLGERAILRDCTVTSGARVTRQQGFVTFAGEHADAKVSGAYLLKAKQHCDTRLVIDHQVPNCTSRELFKCVVDEQARGIFQGKVVVRRDAQKTDGKQSSHALLLSPDAEFDSKPELEIFADDVVCGHGSTVGELDEDQLFYLRARGISVAGAKAMLTEAFVGEVVEGIAHVKVRRALGGHAARWLEQLGVAA
jgi:Fe-S cluster assembly protein SufD